MAKQDRQFPKNFSKKELAAISKEMAELIHDNTLIALEAEAALEAANDLLQPVGLKDESFYGGKCYATVQNSLALNLSICLARLFEEPNIKKQHPDHSDVASIPLLILTLQKQDCRDVLCEAASQWTPQLNGMEEHNSKACAEAIDAAINKYNELKNSVEGASALQILADIRNKRVAHSLRKITNSNSKYKELFMLMDAARDITFNAMLAIEGLNHDLGDAEKEYYREAKAFWEPALLGVKNSLNKKLARTG